jgi:hypothetical protein
MSRGISGFATTITSLINTFKELSAESSEITTSLESLKDQSAMVKTGYAQMLSMTNKLLEAMIDLSQLAKSKDTAQNNN